MRPREAESVCALGQPAEGRWGRGCPLVLRTELARARLWPEVARVPPREGLHISLSGGSLDISKFGRGKEVTVEDPDLQ